MMISGVARNGVAEKQRLTFFMNDADCVLFEVVKNLTFYARLSPKNDRDNYFLVMAS